MAFRKNKLNQPRIGVWVQNYDYDSKSKCDTIVATAKDHGITDLYALVVNNSVSPKITLGYSNLCNQTSTLFDGIPPFAYLCREANACGIRVHAWWCIFQWTWWGGSTAVLKTYLVDNATNHDTSGGGSTINFSTPAVRTAVVNAIKEFAYMNPGAAGVNLDYIRTDGSVTGQTDADVTALVSEVRTAIPDREISVCGLSVYNANSKHQDIPTWTQNNYINAVTVMAYYDNLGKKLWYWDQCDFSGKSLMVGVGMEDASSTAEYNCTTPSDTRATFRQYFNAGFRNFCLFSWGDNFDAPARIAALDDYLRGDINAAAPYPKISSASIVPDTSITLVIDGTTYTTNHSTVTDHTLTATLKTHIEELQGQRPWIHYQRPTTTAIRFQIGDWEL